MARKFLTSVDLNKNELLNAAIQNLASAPSTPVEGQVYFNTTDDTIYVWANGAWLDLGVQGGAGATNLGATLSATDVIITSDTGNDATIPAADTTNAGVMTEAMFDKLAGIEALADVTDAANVAAAGAIMDGDFSANGVMIRTASGSHTSRTITGTANRVVVTNGDGVSGNPTLDVGTNVYVSGGTDVPVTDGGTGRSTSTTAYGVLAAGTTATGAHQTIAPGTSGHFLKSAGGAALAAFAAIAQADVTNLVSDLALKAPLASPTFTGTVTVPTPAGATDATTKGYVDGLVNGVKWKDAVRAATAVAGTLASSFENGDVIDGVTLATGDRILIKDQAAGAENGIYTVNASGAPTRATDADSAAEIKQATVFVQEGTANADSQWTLTNDGTITLGSTVLVFALAGTNSMPAASLTVAGKVELATDAETNTGTDTTRAITPSNLEAWTGSAQVTTVGTLASGNATAIVDAASTTAAGKAELAIAAEAEARTDAVRAVTPLSLANFPVKKIFTIGDGAATQYDVTHSLGTKEVITQVRQASDDVVVECDVTNFSTTVVRLNFAVAPASNAIKVVVMG